jgi:hypothetical protein
MVAPLIGMALGLAAEFGPGLVRHFAGDKAADVTDKVIGAAKAVTGKDDPNEAVEMIRADPALAAQLRQNLASLEVEVTKAYLADRQNARQRDVEMRKAGYSNSRADLMVAGAGVVLVSCLGCLVLLKGDLPGEAVGIISTVAGIAGACLKDAFQFEFGSSRGSKEKDRLMAGSEGA